MLVSRVSLKLVVDINIKNIHSKEAFCTTIDLLNVVLCAYIDKCGHLQLYKQQEIIQHKKDPK